MSETKPLPPLCTHRPGGGPMCARPSVVVAPKPRCGSHLKESS